LVGRLISVSDKTMTFISMLWRSRRDRWRRKYLAHRSQAF